MNFDRQTLRELFASDLLDFFIRLGLIALAIVACERVFAPFLPIMLWALILAVSFYPLHLGFAARAGLSDGRAATLLVLGIVLIIGVPTVLLGVSFAEHTFTLVREFDAAELAIDPPAESVRDWPVIGEYAFDAWSLAASDMPAFLEEVQPHLRNFMRAALASASTPMPMRGT